MSGYKDKLTLRAQDGRRVEIEVPGRRRRMWWDHDAQPACGTEELILENPHYRDEKKIRAQDRQLRRLLSAGWTPVRSGGGNREEGPATGQGGDEDPSKGEDGKKSKRGCRGGRSHGKKNGQGGNRQSSLARKPVKVSWAKQKSSCPVYSPQPVQVTREVLKSAERSAELLAELVGRSLERTRQGIDVKVFDLIVALETGDNPLPSIEHPRERPRARVLISPDSSGSTQSWSGLGKAWAIHLAKIPDADVVFLDNFNGSFVLGNDWKCPEIFSPESYDETERLLGRFDIVVYLGDGDGKYLCHRYAERGAFVVALDCFSARKEKPRVAADVEKVSGGRVVWVDRCSAKAPDTWTRALQLVLSR